MKKIALLTIGCLTSLGLHASAVIDVFGTDKVTSAALIKKYGKEASSISDEVIAANQKGETKTGNALFQKAYNRRIALINKISKEYGFSYVELDTLTYSRHKVLSANTTIEVIDAKDKDRMQFLSPFRNGQKAWPIKHDLVGNMQTYQAATFKLLLAGQLEASKQPCPVYHCLPGFDHPKLAKKFAALHAAEREKNLIFRTMKTDPDPERRAAAIFLMGHFKDPKEIITIATRFTKDGDSGVRNAAMRVISETMDHAKIYDVDVMPFIQFLESPYATDRNKALAILAQAAHSPQGKKRIMQNGMKQLIAQLELKQPCNRDPSHLVLKRISGKNFKKTNIAAWKQLQSENRAVG